MDVEKAKAVGAGFTGRVKKRPTKPAKSGSKVPWGKLLSQHSQVCFLKFPSFFSFGLDFGF